jgi:predicted TIM-barrel fold metal-dependent hydrolase
MTSTLTFMVSLQPVLEAFGPDRVIFGSDWPVLLQNNATYQDVVKLADNHIQHYLLLDYKP